MLDRGDFKIGQTVKNVLICVGNGLKFDQLLLSNLFWQSGHYVENQICLSSKFAKFNSLLLEKEIESSTKIHTKVFYAAAILFLKLKRVCQLQVAFNLFIHILEKRYKFSLKSVGLFSPYTKFGF